MYKGSKYAGRYKPKTMTQDNRLANQQRLRYAKVVANRGGGAPLSNRGFGSMGVLANRERKYFDTPSAAYNVDVGGNFTLAHIPRLGADYNNRIGRKTIIKSIYVRGRVTLLESLQGVPPPGNPPNFVGASQARMIIFLDNQPNGAAPAVLDLLTVADPSAQLNPNNRDRFKVIKDKMFMFDTYVSYNSATNIPFFALNRTTHDIKCYKKLNIETIFNSTNGGTIGDITTGALYVFWIGSNAAASVARATAAVSIRCRFDDS